MISLIRVMMQHAHTLALAGQRILSRTDSQTQTVELQARLASLSEQI